jgi:hypothetical protein
MQRAENVVLKEIKKSDCIYKSSVIVFKKGMYTLVSYMYNFYSVQITVVLNVQNFGKCLSFNVSSVAGFDNSC